MNLDRVFDQIDAEAIAADVLEFVKVNSESGRDGEGSKFFADLLRREGFDVTLDEVEKGQANVYTCFAAPTAGQQSRPSLVFNGHVDTIPVGNCAAPSRSGEWVTGRGTEDMKGGLVATVHAVAALRKAKVQLGGDVWLTGVVDHESPAGRKTGPRRLIHRLNHKDVVADAIIIAEGPCAIWRASLGNSIFTFRIESELGPIHTLKVPFKQNPAFWLGELLHEFGRMEDDFASAAPHPICGRENLNVGVVSGGDYFNRLPTPITVSGKWRWMPGKTFDKLHRELQQLCEDLSNRSGLRFSVSFTGTREPHETPEAHRIVESLKIAGKVVAGRTPEVIGMGLAGDANYYANEAGIPTVYFGPAHETSHSDRERVAISQLVHCAKVYAAAAVNFCGIAQPDPQERP